MVQTGSRTPTFETTAVAFASAVLDIALTELRAAGARVHAWD